MSPIALELKRIAEANKGLLLPEDVVEAAKDDSSPLHSSFTWDDTEAAIKYRLVQARQLISVAVEYVDVGDKRVPVRAYVSLSTDRTEKGGYRPLASVLNDDGMRLELLQDALEEMRRFEYKYKTLGELQEVVKAMRAVKEELLHGTDSNSVPSDNKSKKTVIAVRAQNVQRRKEYPQ